MIDGCRDPTGHGCPDLLQAIYDAGYPSGHAHGAISLAQIPKETETKNSEDVDQKYATSSTALVMIFVAGLAFFSTSRLQRSSKDD